MGKKGAPKPKHTVFENVTPALPLEIKSWVDREAQWDFNTSWP